MRVLLISLAIFVGMLSLLGLVIIIEVARRLRDQRTSKDERSETFEDLLSRTKKDRDRRDDQ